MKYISLAIALVALALTSCEQLQGPAPTNSSPDPKSVSPNVRPLAKQPSDFVTLARALRRSNSGQGAIFLDPRSYGYNGYGIFALKNIVWDCTIFPPFCFPISGQIAGFDGNFGTGDYWRQNPNGTLSVKLVTNQASAFLYDYGTGEYYSGSGGHMNTKFTGSKEDICYDPCYPYDGTSGCDPICFTSLTPDPSINAHVGTGRANVTGPGGVTRSLQMRLVANPGGQSRLDFTLN